MLCMGTYKFQRALIVVEILCEDIKFHLCNVGEILCGDIKFPPYSMGETLWVR